MNVQNVSSTYDAWSALYDETPNPLIAVEESVVRSLLRAMEFNHVLDAATGTGRYAIHLAGQGKRVSAMDASRKMLSIAQGKALAQQLTVNFCQEDISSLSFRDSSFDLVICALALSHVQDLGAPCRELVRVLKHGGHLIISDLHPEIQAMMGPCHKEIIQGKERFFPAYHPQVDDYLEAVKLTGAEVLSVIDVPMETERGRMPGALIICAENKSHRS